DVHLDLDDPRDPGPPRLPRRRLRDRAARLHRRGARGRQRTPPRARARPGQARAPPGGARGGGGGGGLPAPRRGAPPLRPGGVTRHERLRRGLEERGCDCAILVGPDHAVHLASYSRFLSAATAVVVGDDGARTLVVPRYELAAAEGHADRVVAYGEEGFL